MLMEALENREVKRLVQKTQEAESTENKEPTKPVKKLRKLRKVRMMRKVQIRSHVCLAKRLGEYRPLLPTKEWHDWRDATPPSLRARHAPPQDRLAHSRRGSLLQGLSQEKHFD
jgi:hypothetical protein